MHDIIVVSDLHLGRGKNAETGRYHRLEAFFFDDDFYAFCRWLCRESAERKVEVKLVLNGDTFDLLRIDFDRREGANARERRFGPTITPERAAATVSEILAGHPGFVAGLAHVLTAGHPVVILPGNHDLELQWAPVQDAVRDAIAREVRAGGDEAAAESAIRELTFEPWFHYEPGRIWIEHGCQYDKDNSFQFFLRSDIVDKPTAIDSLERDMPVGTFFQRYLYNFFGSITFIVPSSRANSRYFRWLLINRPRLLAKVTISHFPFFLQVLRRIAKAGGNTTELADAHSRELDRLASAGDLDGPLQKIDQLKAAHGSTARVARGLLSDMLKIGGLAVLLALLVAGLWFAGFQAINQFDVGVTLKAILFVVLNFVFLLTLTGGIGYTLLRPPNAPPSRPGRSAASRISALLDVPIVTMGHSHDEVVFRLRRDGHAGGWFYNTGTWVAVFTHDELLPRERVQYTFLRVRGNSAELMHYSPGRNDAVPVILIDDDRWSEPEKPVETLPS